MSSRLAERGAVIVDADLVVKELQRPGRPVFEAMVERWGDRIVGPNGTLDRAAVAAIAFGDPDELAALNTITHPAVRAEMRVQTEAAAHTDRVVVLDIPLLAEGKGDRRGASAVIVVDCPVEVAVERLMAHRGFDRADAEARVKAQATREQRLAMADHVIDNGGDLDQLDAQVAGCWDWILTLDPTPWPPPDDQEHRRPPA